MSIGESLDEDNERTRLIAWVASGSESSEELIAIIRSLQANALSARDLEVGLTGELVTARARIRKIESTEPGQAFKRVDKLEEQREQLLHRLRLGNFGDESDDEVAQLKASATWRAGRALVAPIAFVKQRVLRR